MKYKKILYNQLKNNIEPDCEDFYLCEIEEKAKKYDELIDYLIKLLEQDNYYFEELEDTVVFIESHINHIKKENQKYKEVIDKATEYINGAYEMATYTKSVVLDEENIEDLLDILKEVK